MNRIVHKDMLQNMFINVFDLLSESLNLWTDVRQHYLDQHVWVADDDQKSFWSRDRHVEAFGVGHKAQCTLQIIAW